MPYFTSWSLKSNWQSVSVSYVHRSQYKFSTSVEKGQRSHSCQLPPCHFVECRISPFFTSVLHQHSIKTEFLKQGLFSLCQMQEWHLSNPRKWGRWSQGWILTEWFLEPSFISHGSTWSSRYKYFLLYACLRDSLVDFTARRPKQRLLVFRFFFEIQIHPEL